MKFEGTLDELRELYLIGAANIIPPVEPEHTDGLMSWLDKRKEDLRDQGKDPNDVYKEIDEIRKEVKTRLEPRAEAAAERVAAMMEIKPYLPGWRFVEEINIGSGYRVPEGNVLYTYSKYGAGAPVFLDEDVWTTDNSINAYLFERVIKDNQ